MRHLEQGVALARQVRRPYLEFSGLAYLAAAETGRSFARAAERSRRAIELAGRHGWTDEPTLGIACLALGSTLTWQGRLEENLYGGVWTLGPCELHPFALLFALSGTLMISKTLHIPKL